IPLLAQLIKDANEKEMLRYFRSFDFHTDPSKQKALTDLIIGSNGDKLLYALKHVDTKKFHMTPTVRAKLNAALDNSKGKLEFVELVDLYKLENRAQDLFELALQYPDSASGREAAGVLLKWNREDMFQKTIASSKRGEMIPMIKVLRAHMGNQK